MTLAVIKTGGKQYLVSEGDTLDIETIEGAKTPLKLEEVLLVDDGKETKVGTPFVEKASVEAEVVTELRDKKVIVFKMKRRKRYRRTQGHRQNKLRIKISKITA
jgi:large subunit ribosomal protein L21